METLPTMNPPSPWAIEQNLFDQRRVWLDSKDSRGWDGERVGRVAMANLNMLLDYYPDGMPRDNTVEFHAVEDFSPVEAGDNVILGEE